MAEVVQLFFENNFPLVGPKIDQNSSLCADLISIFNDTTTTEL